MKVWYIKNGFGFHPRFYNLQCRGLKGNVIWLQGFVRNGCIWQKLELRVTKVICLCSNYAGYRFRINHVKNTYISLFLTSFYS